MPDNQRLQDALFDIVEIARSAPSVHNTQPWIISAHDKSIFVEIDKSHQLTYGDPTGRETIISLGIMAEALAIGARACGFSVNSIDYVNGKAVIITSAYADKISNSAPGEVELLRRRATDRSVYKKVSISESTLHGIEQQARNKDVKVWTSVDAGDLSTIANLTSQGIGLALSNPTFRKELSQYLVVPWSSKKRGIGVKSLYIFSLLAVMEPWFMRLGIGLNSEKALEKKRWASSSAIVFITAKGDMPDYWFQAGRTYLKVSLAIEKAGLSQATSAATVEASTFHEDVEQLLGTQQRLLCVLRIGLGSKRRRYSPRVDTNKLIAT